MLRWFPSSKLLLHASHAALPVLNLSKLSPVVDASKLYVFPNYCNVIKNSKFRCKFEATSYHYNVFTFTLFLSEGRAGLVWEPSNKVMLSPLEIKCLSFLPPISSLHLLFINPSSLSPLPVELSSFR
jgi:hypothetical protein